MNIDTNSKTFTEWLKSLVTYAYDQGWDDSNQHYMDGKKNLETLIATSVLNLEIDAETPTTNNDSLNH